MKCPHCKKEIPANPWITLIHQVVVLAVVSLWWSTTVGTWDDEPYVLAAIFTTMLALAFGKDHATKVFRRLMDGGGR